MLLIFIFTLCAALAQAQTSIGLDLSSFLYKEMNIAIEHKISEHWSASASGGINLKVLKRHITDEEAERIINETPFTDITVFNTSTKARVEKYEEYKANREAMPDTLRC